MGVQTAQTSASGLPNPNHIHSANSRTASWTTTPREASGIPSEIDPQADRGPDRERSASLTV